MTNCVVLAAMAVGQFGFGGSDYGYRGTPHTTVNVYQKSYGEVLMDIESARRMRIDNWAHNARTRWSIQDEYQARERERLSYLNRLERRIEAIERSKVLTARYIELTGRNP